VEHAFNNAAARRPLTRRAVRAALSHEERGLVGGGAWLYSAYLAPSSSSQESMDGHSTVSARPSAMVLYWLAV